MLAHLLRNAGYLLGSRALRDLMGLGALVTAARVLGPERFGVLIMVQSYVVAIDWLVNFQSWQALVQFGTPLHSAADHRSMKGLLRLTLALDGGSALLGAGIGVAAAGLAGRWLGWGEGTVLLARIYCLVILLNLSGSATGLLRLVDRFDLLAAQGIAAAAVKLVGVCYAAVVGLGLEGFLIIWVLTDAVSYLVMLGCGAWVYWRQGYAHEPAEPLSQVLKGHAGLVRFFLVTNWHSTVRMATKEADVLVVGAVLGKQAVGLFKVVKQIASLLARLGDPLYQAVYPEMARLWADGRRLELRRLLAKSLWMGALPGVAFWVLFAAVGGRSIELVLGPDYQAVYGVTVIYLVPIAIAVATFAYHPTMLAMGRPADSFRILLVATALYFAVLVPLMGWLQLAGAAWAYLVFYVIWGLAMSQRLVRLLREGG